jgi:hypothetical protein
MIEILRTASTWSAQFFTSWSIGGLSVQPRPSMSMDEPEMVGMRSEVSGVRLGVAADAARRRDERLGRAPDWTQRVRIPPASM